MNANVLEIIEEIVLCDVITGKYVDRIIKRKSLCPKCLGTGQDDGILRACRKCQGRCILVNFIDEIPTTRKCDYCDGLGINITQHKCQFCNGVRIIDEDFKIHYLVPIGVQDGEVIKLLKVGNIILGNNRRTDVMITIRIMEDITFKVKYKDLHINLDVSLFEALGGLSKDIVLPDKNIHHIQVKYIKPNDNLIVHNLGLPYKGNKNIRGNLCIHFNVIFPNELSDELSSKFRSIFQ